MADEPDPDLELMQRIGRRDAAALEEIYRRYAPRLGRYLQRLCGERETVEEVLQDTFLGLWNAAPTYRHDAKVGTFLYTIARNAAINRIRRQAPKPPPAETDAGADPIESAARDEERGRVRAAVDELPDTERETLALVLDQGLSYADAAKVLDVPVGTVKSRLHRAVEHLRRSLEGGARNA